MNKSTFSAKQVWSGGDSGIMAQAPKLEDLVQIITMISQYADICPDSFFLDGIVFEVMENKKLTHVFNPSNLKLYPATDGDYNLDYILSLSITG